MTWGFVAPAYMRDMTDINAVAASARESARQTTGQFGEQEHSAPELALDDVRPALEPVQWTPEAEARGEFADVFIAAETNPWLQVDGHPVDLTGIDNGAAVDCDGCNDSGAYAGIVLAMDSNDGIQMCDACGKFEGDLEAAQHAAEVLTKSTGREHTVWFEPEARVAEPATPIKNADPRYIPGVSESDDDMSDKEWLDVNGHPPFEFDRNYRNTEQVRPYLAEFQRVYADLEEARGRHPYDSELLGKVAALSGSTEKNETTALYLLKTLHDLDELTLTQNAFIEAGGRKVTAEDLEPGQVLRGTIAKSGFYMGGTGWKVNEDIRLRVREYPNGRRGLEYVEKGKRNGHPLGDGDIYFRED